MPDSVNELRIHFMTARILFVLFLVFSLTPWASPPIALVLGLALGLTVGNPFINQTRETTKWLLQASVVGLGFGMNLYEVIRAGRSGFLYTAIGIAFALALGMLLTLSPESRAHRWIPYCGWNGDLWRQRNCGSGSGSGCERR